MFGVFKNFHLAISIIANILSVAVSMSVSFFLTPFLIKTLGKEAYSFYPLANNFVGYMTIITLALNSMASRFISIELAKKHVTVANKYFSSVFYSNVILSVLLMIPMAIVVVKLELFLNIPLTLERDVKLLFSLVFISLIINLISSVFGVSTFAKERMDLRAIQVIVISLFRAVLFLALFIIFRPKIFFFGIVACLVALINGSFQFVFSKRLMPECQLNVSYYDKSSVIVLLKSGIWNSINNIGSILTMSISILVANTLLGVSEAGDMSIVQTMPHIISSVISAVYGVFLARIARIYATQEKSETVEYVKQTQKFLGVICAVPVVVLIILGKYFFQLWIPGEDANYLQNLSIVALFPVLIHSCMWTVYGLNVTNNKIKVPALCLIAVGFFSLLLSLLLIKNTNMGIYSIVVSNSICNGLFYMLFIPIYTSSKLKIKLNSFYGCIFRTFLFTLFMTTLAYPLSHFLDSFINNWLTFIISGVLFEVVGVIIYMLIVFSRQDFCFFYNTIRNYR